MLEKSHKKNIVARVEVQPKIWLPEAYHFGNLMGSRGINYAIFGAGALAVHNVMLRPTVDIDFVVDNYKQAIDLINEQPGIASKNLQKEKDGIQVADFNFKSGVTVQIWDNNLYSVPMTDDSWSSVTLKLVPGFDSIKTISMEDLIVSKVGRYTQQRTDSQYEADKNVTDIVSTIQALAKPDFKYVIQRLKEGARRESSSNSSKIHPLIWYFVREVPVYSKAAKGLNQDKIGTFIATVLVNSKSPLIEYELLHTLRKSSSIKTLQSSFMLDNKSLRLLTKRWEKILKISGDEAALTSKDIQEYVNSLVPESTSEYAKKLIFSGKKS